MKAKQLIEEFERAESLAREAVSQDQVAGIIRQLLALTLRHMKQNYRNDRWVMPAPSIPPKRIAVDSDTRWC